MQDQDLIILIKDRFRRGQTRGDIKEALMQEGWTDIAIDDAITSIRHEALRQIPIISSFYRWFDALNEKEVLKTPRMMILVLGVSIALIAVIIAILYFLFDPLGYRADNRDVRRKADMTKIRQAIQRYALEKKMYPERLDSLVPNYLQSIPLDPNTGMMYEYHLLNNGNSLGYEICTVYELKKDQSSCLSDTLKQLTIPDVSY